MKRDRFEIANKLQGESLVRKGLLESYEGRPQIRLMPDLNVIKIGGHGIIDYGKEVVLPLLEEIGDLSLRNQILVVAGGGVRVRHILDVGLDLGMPTGILAELAGKISEQNALLVATLLSRWNGTRIHVSDLLDLPMLMSLGVLPVTHGTPPYGLYEQPAEIGSIPPNRTDTGAFLAAEVLGAKNLILVKNVDGLYTDNPFTHPRAELIPDITASELLAMNLEDMVLEKRVVELLRYAKNVQEVKIVNGHNKGSIRKVLSGGKPGTIIRAR